jgi:hypothetical protein
MASKNPPVAARRVHFKFLGAPLNPNLNPNPNLLSLALTD